MGPICEAPQSQSIVQLSKLFLRIPAAPQTPYPIGGTCHKFYASRARTENTFCAVHAAQQIIARYFDFSHEVSRFFSAFSFVLQHVFGATVACVYQHIRLYMYSEASALYVMNMQYFLAA